MQAKCTAARAQVNMLCTHTDTPGRSRGLRRWEGDRAVSPGTTDTRTHIHTAAPAGSARGLGTRWGCRAQTQRVLTARHGTETWTWSLGTELEDGTWALAGASWGGAGGYRRFVVLLVEEARTGLHYASGSYSWYSSCGIGKERAVRKPS